MTIEPAAVSPEDEVLVAQADGVVTITLNRPTRRNAIRLSGWQRLSAVIRAAGADSAVRVIIVRGAGTVAFSAGADLDEFPTVRADRAGAARYHEAVVGVFRALGTVPQPTVAMIHGYCIGGGCELAIACDLRLADQGAQFAIPAARLGVVLGVDELRALRDLIGTAAAKELLLTGKRYTAAEALQLGLVGEVLPAADLETRTLALAQQIAAADPLALTAIKDLLGRLARDDDAVTLATAQAAFAQRAFAPPAQQAGIRSFLTRKVAPEQP